MASTTGSSEPGNRAKNIQDQRRHSGSCRVLSRAQHRLQSNRKKRQLFCHPVSRRSDPGPKQPSRRLQTSQTLGHANRQEPDRDVALQARPLMPEKHCAVHRGSQSVVKNTFGLPRQNRQRPPRQIRTHPRIWRQQPNRFRGIHLISRQRWVA